MGSAEISIMLAYLTNQYPKISHTFIRREIRELERLGHRILRVAIRSPLETLVDPVDLEEARATLVVLAQPVGTLLRAALRGALRRPGRFARALRTALRMGLRGDRGLVVHLAYLIEACYLRELFETRSVRHVHVHFGTNAATVALLVRLLGGPSYSLTIHGPDEFDSVRALGLMAKVEEASFTVAISDFTAAQLMRWVDPRCWERIHVIRCAVDQAFFAAGRPIDEHSLTLICVGRLAPQKGHLILVDAVAELVHEGMDLKLILVGDGELRLTIEERIKTLDIASHVSITGWVDEATVRKLLVEARCLVLPSFGEGLPVVIMEAMALGRPVVSTFVAGIPELVEPGRNGWLVPAGSVVELKRALREVCSAPVHELNEMGQAGRAAVMRYNRLDVEVGKLAACFEGIGAS
jgi:glycosyltransferase involved in cell wall biosynthesis